MIVTFKSAAAGDVIMFGDVARRMMELMGKRPDAQGIVTVEQLPDAIARLRAAAAADKARHAGLQDEDLPQNETGESGKRPYVSLAQRAAPLLEVLEWAQQKKKPVTWGV
jgi:hypothetical protein